MVSTSKLTGRAKGNDLEQPITVNKGVEVQKPETCPLNVWFGQLSVIPMQPCFQLIEVAPPAIQSETESPTGALDGTPPNRDAGL